MEIETERNDHDQIEDPELVELVNKDAPVVEEAPKPKKKNLPNRLRAEIVTDSDEGLFKLYKQTKQTIESNENSAPDKFVSAILANCRSWSHNLLTRYDHVYFLERLQALGKDPLVKTFMGKLREVHTGELSEADFIEIYKKNPIVIPAAEPSEKYQRGLKDYEKKKPRSK